MEDERGVTKTELSNLKIHAGQKGRMSRFTFSLIKFHFVTEAKNLIFQFAILPVYPDVVQQL